MTVAVVVEGRPVPKGSLSRNRAGYAYFPRRVVEWQAKVAAAIDRAMSGVPRFECPVRVGCRFYLEPTRGGKAPGRLIGDADKLARTVLDALEGRCVGNDEQVVGLLVSKQAVEAGYVARAEITVVAA